MASPPQPALRPDQQTETEPSLLRRVFKAFRYHDFRLLWIGACTSSIGTWMQKLAQSWLVYQLSGSAFVLGLDAFLGDAPILALSLFGGVFADRRDRRKLLLASQFVQMGSAFTLAALFAFGHVQIWQILALSFVSGTAQAFGGPAYQALLPSLVDSADVPNAIALNSIQFNLARLVGPMLGGLALQHLGAAWCFGLNGLSFIAVISTLLAVRLRYVPPRSHQPVLASMKEGLVFVRRQPSMQTLVLLAFMVTALGVPVTSFLPVMAKEVFHGGASLFTVLLSLSAAGAVCGALVVAALDTRGHRGRPALLMLTLLGLCVAAFAQSRLLPLSAVLIFVAGGALIAVFALISSLVQLLAQEQMRGRVMSVYNVAFRGGMPIGNLVTGILIPQFTAPVVLSIDGLLLAGLGLYFLFVQRRVTAL